MDARPTEVGPADASVPPGSVVAATALQDSFFEERGAFAHGRCRGCDWVGPGRRARERARADAERHLDVHRP
ncbi:MAG: hypothetical protein ABI083_11610 [Lapillicoccus sp.]